MVLQYLSDMKCFTMKDFLPLLILVSNILYGGTTPENLDDDQLREGRIVMNEWGEEIVDPETAAQNLQEDLFASSEEVGVKLNGEDRLENEEKDLIGKDYFRIDSGDSEMEGRQVQPNMATKVSMKPREMKQYQAEIEAGDPTQMFATNVHLSQPQMYPDFGRRFVLQYPYKEVVNENKLKPDEDEDEDKVDKSLIPIKENKWKPDKNEDEDKVDNSLIPIKAPPEVVLAIAKESAMLDAASPVDPTEEVIRKNILRTGQYWNGFWKEDLDPKASLRRKKRNKMQSVYAQLSPGTELYKIFANLKRFNPKLLYVINKKDNH